MLGHSPDRAQRLCAHLQSFPASPAISASLTLCQAQILSSIIVLRTKACLECRLHSFSSEFDYLLQVSQ